MAIRIQCPSCGTTFTCSSEKEGKRIACPECDERFVAEPAETRVQAVPPKLAAAKRSRADDEAPRRVRAAPAAKQGSSANLILILGGLGGIGFVVLLVAGGLLTYLFTRGADAPVDNKREPARPVIAEDNAPAPAQKFHLEESRKSVVFLRVFAPGAPPATGSGFFVTQDGLIATNRHVLEGDDGLPFGARVIVGVPRVEQPDAFDHYQAEIAYVPPRDDATDFALVKIKAAPNAPPFRPLPLIARDTVALGTEVAALGYPFAGDDKINISFTKGSISSTRVTFNNKSFYQTDAAVNPGNSGGPLLNANGEVVGIVTLRRSNADNVGFALYLGETNLRNLPVADFAQLQPLPGPLPPLACPIVRTVAARKENWSLERGQLKEAKNALVLIGDNELSSFWITSPNALPEHFQLSFVSLIATPDGKDKGNNPGAMPGFPRIGPPGGFGPRGFGPGFSRKINPARSPMMSGNGAPLLSIRLTSAATNNDILQGDGLTFLQSPQNLQLRINRQSAGVASTTESEGVFLVTLMKSGNTVVYYLNGKEQMRADLPPEAQGNLRVSVGGVRGFVVMTDLYVERYNSPLALGAPPANQPIAKIVPNPAPPIQPPIVPNNPPAVKHAGFVANANPRDVNGLRVQDLYSDADDVLPCMLWGRDGKHAYFLEKNGTLRKISSAGPKEVAKETLPQTPCEWLADSAEGLLVSVPRFGLFVIDPETLKVKKTIPIQLHDRFGSHPQSSLAFATIGVNDLAMVDLKTGAVVKTHKPSEFGQSFCFTHPVISPDQKYLYAEGFFKIHRFELNGTELKLQQISTSIRGREFALSGDGKYLLTGSAGAAGLSLFTCDNLAMPAFKIKPQGGLKVQTPSRDGERIFASHQFKQFAIVDKTGNIVKEIDLPGFPPWPRQIVMAPDDKSALVLLTNRVYLIENIP